MTFYDYFKENMNAMGLPAPREWYGTPLLVTGALKEIVGAVDKLGKSATVAEALGATTAKELLGVGTTSPPI